MATHSSVLDWRIPGTGEPGGLPSLGSHRVIHNWSDLAAAAAASKKWHFPGGLVVKDLCANAGDAGEASLAPGWGSSPGGRNSYPLQYSCWENPMDRGACQTTVCGVTKSWATDARQESKTGLRSGLPWWSSGLRFCLPMQEVWVWSLVEGVKIHMPCNGKTKT